MKRSVFIILCLEGALLSFNLAASAALVPAIAEEFALSKFLVGRAIWLYMLPYGVAALFYGPLVRCTDAKKIELISVSCFSLANLGAALCSCLNAFFAARFFAGLFGASVIPLALILIGRQVEQKRRGSYVGVFFSFSFVASLAGLFLSGLLYWRLIYFIPAIAGVSLSILIYFFFPSFRAEDKALRFAYGEALKDKRVASIFTYIFLVSLLYHGVQQWLGVYFAVEFGFRQFVVSMLVTLTSLSGIFGEAGGGWLADALGRVKTANLGAALMALSVLALAYKTPLATLAFLMVLWGLGWTINHAGISTALTDLPERFLNESASLNSGVRFISGGLGVFLAGVITRRSFHLNFLFSAAALIILMASSQALLLPKREE